MSNTTLQQAHVDPLPDSLRNLIRMDFTRTFRVEKDGGMTQIRAATKTWMKDDAGEVKVSETVHYQESERERNERIVADELGD